MSKRDPLKLVIKEAVCRDMAHALAVHKHNPVIQTLIKEKRNIGLLVYNLAHKGKLKEMAGLPQGWLPEESYIDIYAKDSKQFTYYRTTRYCDANGSKVQPTTSPDLRIELPKAMRKLKSHDFYTIDRLEPLVLDYVEKHRQYLQEKEDKDETEERMYSLIRSHGTFAKLYEAWPEVKALVSIFEPSPPVKHHLAIPNTQALNKEFGLPI